MIPNSAIRTGIAAAFALALLLGGRDATADKLRLPGIKGNDDRALVESSKFPWSAIGRVNRTIGGFCTGTVIADRQVLTAAHCLWNNRTRRWLPPSSLHFVAGYKRGRYVRHARVIRFDVSPGYRAPPEKTGSRAEDWAVLHLDLPIGRHTGIVRIAKLNPGELSALRRQGGTVLQAGYSQDKAHILSVHRNCAITGFQAVNRLVVHDCDATHGDSGSPILAQDRSGFRLFAMHIATLRRGRDTFGLAIAANPGRFRTDAGTPDKR